MAQKRMFSVKITESDAFLDMPISSQLLYFHLSMNADDDGFISSPKKIMRITGCKDDDLKVLIAKQFIIPFESGIVVIKHWHIHNTLKKDRYQETMHMVEKAELELIEKQYFTNTDAKCFQNVSKVEPQIRLDKIRLDKNSKDIIHTEIFNFWNANTVNLTKCNKLTEKHESAINGLIKDGYDKEQIQLGISNYNHIVNGSQYYFNYKWNLLDFLKRTNACRHFADLTSDKQYLHNNASAIRAEDIPMS